MPNTEVTIERIATVLLADAIATCWEQDNHDRELPSLSGQELTTYFPDNMEGFNAYIEVYCIKFKTELNTMLAEIMAKDVGDWVEYVVNRSERIVDLAIDSCDLLDHNWPIIDCNED